jgi:hypothetical protein
LNLGEDRQARLQPRSAEGVNRRAVGLVVGRLEDQGDTQFGAHGGVLGRHLQGELATLEHVDAAEQHEGRIVGDAQGPRPSSTAAVIAVQPVARIGVDAIARRVLAGGLDVAGKQRVSATRPRGELRVELAGDEPGSVPAARSSPPGTGPRTSRQRPCRAHELLDVVVVDLVAVSMALADHRLAVDFPHAAALD